MADIESTIITAGAAAVAAFLGSIGRPLADDKVRQWAERREASKRHQDQRVARIEHVAALLASVAAEEAGAFWTPRQKADFQSIVAAAVAVGDEELVTECEAFVAQRGLTSLHNAQRRCGALLRKTEGTS
ncbi:MAG TPA: hypothetical protein VNF73_00435 [Candidatus Saccharimonadales bacterium]|nr:hypothetical protein [Candidatus Saccharimonadales bacterium]